MTRDRKRSFTARCLRLSLILSLAASGCVRTAAPSAQTPITDLGAFSASGGAAIPSKWWTAFGDAALDGLVEQALAQGFDVRVAWARLTQAEAAARAAGASTWPSLNATASAGASARGDTSTADTSTSIGLGLAASYELDLWGGISAGRAAAARSAQAAQLDVEAAAITVAGQLASAWYQRASIAASAALLAEQLRASEATLALIEAKVAAGAVPPLDATSQAQAVEALRGQLTTTGPQLAALEHAINLLRGAAPNAPLPAAPTTLPAVPALPSTGVPAEVLTQRPDVMAAWLRVQAADRSVAVALAERYPRLSLSASLSSTGQLSGWLANLAANLTAPLLDGGARAAAVDRSKAELELSLLSYQRAVVAAAGEVEDALVAEAGQAALVASLDRQLELAAKVADGVRASYAAGGTDQLRVLDAERTYQGLARSRVSAQAQQLDDRIALYRALAGRLALTRPAEPAAEPRNSQVGTVDPRALPPG